MSSVNGQGLFRKERADVLLEVLESEGIEYIFNPGTTELPLIDAPLRHHWLNMFCITGSQRLYGGWLCAGNAISPDSLIYTRAGGLELLVGWGI